VNIRFLAKILAHSQICGTKVGPSSKNGVIACDSFHNYDIDIDNIVALGVHFYRFSISWTRLIPTGVLSEGINENGIEYYIKVLQQLEMAFKFNI